MMMLSILLVNAALVTAQFGGEIDEQYATMQEVSNLIEVVDAEDFLSNDADYDYDLYIKGANGLEPASSQDYLYADVTLDYDRVLTSTGKRQIIEHPERKMQLALFMNGLGSSITSDANIGGSYSFTGLYPGKYVLLAEKAGYYSQYYNKEGTWGDADPVTLGSGKTATNINFVLARSYIGLGSAPAENTNDNGFAKGASGTLGAIGGSVTSSGTPLAATVTAYPVELTFAAGEGIVVGYNMVAATKTVILEGTAASAEVSVIPEKVDVYVAIKTPKGKFLYTNPFSGTTRHFYSKPNVYVSDVRLSRMFGFIGVFRPGSNVAPGTYEMWAVLVSPGKSVGNPANHLSNIAKISIRYRIDAPL
jgi:hypothetical protein